MTDESSTARDAEGGPTLPDWVDSERLLLVGFLVVAGYFFVTSFSFGRTAGLFPEMTSGVVIVGSILLLLQDYLPERVRRYVAESAELLGSQEDMGQELEAQIGRVTDDDTGDDETERHWGMTPSVFTAASVLGYFVTSLLFGMLWMSPIYALVYSTWSRHSWYTRVALTAMAFVLGYAFMTVLNLPLEDGLLVTFKLGMWGI